MKADEIKHHILYLLPILLDKMIIKPMTIKAQCPKFIFKFLKCVCVYVCVCVCLRVRACVCYRARDVCPAVGDAK